MRNRLWSLAVAVPATKLAKVADTAGMEPGVSKWIADLYNSNLWIFGLVTVLVMAGMGAVLGFAFDRLLALLKLDLGKLERRE